MTVQQGQTWRARPVCDTCRWTGRWHTSTTDPADAYRSAELTLAEHVAFWHLTDPATRPFASVV